MSAEFYQTAMGQAFFSNQVPNLIKALNRVADVMEHTATMPSPEKDAFKDAITDQKAEIVSKTLGKKSVRNVDADTIFADVMDDAEWDITGQAEELLGLYAASKAKDEFKALFQFFTGVTFDQYLERCICEVARES